MGTGTRHGLVAHTRVLLEPEPQGDYHPLHHHSDVGLGDDWKPVFGHRCAEGKRFDVVTAIFYLRRILVTIILLLEKGFSITFLFESFFFCYGLYRTKGPTGHKIH